MKTSLFIQAGSWRVPRGLVSMIKPNSRRRQAQCAAVEDVLSPASGQSANILPNLHQGQLLDLHRSGFFLT